MTTLPGTPPAGGAELAVDTMDLLRFATIGSVDDGKSTLIGRLLFDTRQLFDDQLTAIETASERRGLGEVDLSFVTDGLRAEREQSLQPVHGRGSDCVGNGRCGAGESHRQGDRGLDERVGRRHLGHLLSPEPTTR